eukprot:Gregarina_sp_Pseudo_9__2146@NODE_249_length_3436_cov_83_448337_g232_i0_p1_GENE_NODE_249_length_3436_cov_83_448337_g232_i0NODE_249_length_3436_cov_83_448337_g232_i0_p1_ORF_typecomplete_len564_score113_21PALP/PF00291_25/2_7e69EutA/PF06277_11/3_1EutA/PF06277_11/7_2ADH_zinc_N/PF00107_26/0_61_NODE_249_length_3436_cov_83_448337_g232_i015803271
MCDLLQQSLLTVLTECAKVSGAPKYDEEECVSVPAEVKPCEKRLAWPVALENGAVDAVGNTPLIRLARLEKAYDLKCKLYAKAEFMSVGGSVKDRIGLAMLAGAEEEGLLKPGDYVIEGTSGNTGVGLAVVCAAKGYRMVVVMPDKMSAEKSSVMKALGAEVVRTRTSANWSDADSHISIAYKLRDEINRRSADGGPRAFVFDQYKNVRNPTVHFQHTAQEIVQQMGSAPADFVVASAGTGGTLAGVSKGIKEAWPSCTVIGVDPAGSILHKDKWVPEDISGYEVEGIGYDFHPPVLSRQYIDSWEVVEDEDAFVWARRVIATEGILCGGSSGTALAAAVHVARRQSEAKSIVIVFPDSIRNYLSKFASDEWMLLHGWDSDLKNTLPLDSTPVADHKWLSVVDKAAPLTKLPVVEFGKASVATALGKCKEESSRHCLVKSQNAENKIQIRILSIEYLRYLTLVGASQKLVSELEYRMSVQLFNESALDTAKAAKFMAAMVQQNIKDPMLLVTEPQDVSESTPMQQVRTTPEIDGLHSFFTIDNMSKLDSIKAVTVSMLSDRMD